MGLFTRDPDVARLSAAIETQTKKLAGIEGKLDAAAETHAVSQEYATAKKQLTDLQITLDRVKEDHAREKREIEHLVGLEKKRQAFEIDSAKRDAILSVREENLAAERERFEESVKFIKETTAQQRDMTEKILARLPDVNVMLGGEKSAPRRRASS